MTITENALEIAASCVGVKEVPPSSNRGPEVDRWIRGVGLNPEGAYPWCAAFIHGCFHEAAAALKIPNPCPRTGSALGMWLKAKPSQRVAAKVARPGMVFVLDLGHGTGHVGFVEAVSARTITTIEGNTNDGGSREGIGVFRRTRVFGKNLRGFLDFSAGV